MGMIPPPSPPTREDIHVRREYAVSTSSDEWIFRDPEFEHSEEQTKGPDGHVIDITVVQQKKKQSGLRPGIFYIHGGGMILGNRKMLLDASFPWIKELDVVLLSLEYRLALEH
jgi:acetyl esterase/lipase